mmetsp:Transcript_5232/g.16606  ORF Transcript_5232/g.16606 Transcript_5232/m.16606 type:complete len:260 (+) Transcript_5232:335-1114(+)
MRRGTPVGGPARSLAAMKARRPSQSSRPRVSHPRSQLRLPAKRAVESGCGAGRLQSSANGRESLPTTRARAIAKETTGACLPAAARRRRCGREFLAETGGRQRRRVSALLAARRWRGQWTRRLVRSGSNSRGVTPPPRHPPRLVVAPHPLREPRDPLPLSRPGRRPRSTGASGAQRCCRAAPRAPRRRPRRSLHRGSTPRRRPAGTAAGGRRRGRPRPNACRRGSRAARRHRRRRLVRRRRGTRRGPNRRARQLPRGCR